MKDDMHEEKLRTFRLFDGMPADAKQIVPRRRKERRPFHVAFVLFCNILFLAFVIGAGFIYALKFGGWV